MRIVLVGPPGAGKGTQAAFLAKNLSIPHISTGDLFRANISQGTDLGKQAKSYMDAGDLVPDEVTIGMAKDRHGAAGRRERLPARRLPAQRLAGRGAGRDAASARASSWTRCSTWRSPRTRWSSASRAAASAATTARTSSTSTYKPPKTEGVCDVCGGELYQRDDDSEDTVRKRLEVYHTQTEPIIDYYKAQGLVVTISALGKVAEVTERAMEAPAGAVREA